MTFSWDYFDETGSPSVHWPLNDVLTEHTGTGLTLSVSTGSERYEDVVPGTRGFYFDGSTVLLAPSNAGLLLSGDLTVGFIIRPGRYPTSSTGSEIIAIGVPNAETGEADNFLFRVLLLQTTAQLRVSWETTGQADVNVDLPYVVLPSVATKILIRRTGLVVDLFVNDATTPTATATASAAPTGGSSGRLRLGGGTTNAQFQGVLAGVIIWGVADGAAPFLTNRTPASGATGVARTASISLRVDDTTSHVDLTTVVIQVNSGSGFVTAYTGSAFQTGFSGSATPASRGYDFVINHSATWDSNQLIQVRVVARDDSVFHYELDETYSFTTVADNSPPFVTNRDPAANATGVARDTDIALRVDDVLNSVVLSTVVITVDLGDGVVTAYDGGAGGFQTGFSGTATPASNGYDFVISPTALIDPVWTVPVRVQAEDDASVPNALDTTYYFSTRLASPTARRVRVLPLSASLRGGIETTVLSGTVLHTIDATLRNTTLPAGWSALGGVRVASRAGLRVTSTGSTAGISYDADVFYGEYAVTVLPLAPASPSTTATLAAIELLIDSSNYIATRLHRTAAARDYIQCVVALAGVLTTCAIPINAAAQHDLFVVRGPDYAYAGYGTRDRRGNWTMQRELIRAAFGIEDPAQLRVYNSNTASARFSDVRAYPVVDFAGERLIAPVYNDRGMVGTLPAATAAGGVTVTWAYDTDTATTPFTYLLPTAKTLTTESVRALKTYQDVALSDDE